MSTTTKGRSAGSSSTRRREELKRLMPRRPSPAFNIIKRPEFATMVLILAGLALTLSVLVVFSRETRLPAVGDVMSDTRLARVEFFVTDEVATEEMREAARANTKYLYEINEPYLRALYIELIGLPVAVASQPTIDDVEEGLREKFALTAIALGELKNYAVAGKVTDPWRNAIEQLVTKTLIERPILSGDDYQVFVTESDRILAEWKGDGSVTPLPGGEAATVFPLTSGLPALGSKPVAAIPTGAEPPLNAQQSELVDRIRLLDIPKEAAKSIVHRLLLAPDDRQPTVVLNQARSIIETEAAAAALEEVKVPYPQGDVIARRGERLSSEQFALLKTERNAWRASNALLGRWLPRFGIAGVLLTLTSFVGIFLAANYPRVVSKPIRLLAIAALSASMLAVTILTASQWPQVTLAAAVGPTLFVTVLLVLAYDQRLALFLSAVQCAFVVLALGGGIAMLVLLAAGCGTMIIGLRDVRQRNTIIRAAGATALVLAATAIVAGFVSLPAADGVVMQVMIGALWAAASGLGVGFLVLGILPMVERIFDITTGLTLIELRDSSQPLLRQLQQRAPGTYNHSLQVASIAEAAANAIGADSLLTYVGALYHDIGKMNKPHYFVENQTPGQNRHDKLRPAMSLLVIIGHVKDGVEIGKEYGLPRQLLHFIEAHHGTTLVEYFYWAAKEEADRDDKSVDEFEFRYPGPRPRTKEVAILMLSDAVESATRAMTDPQPSRIESLVRDISRKRLLDHQFDECPLTLSEVAVIEDAMISRLNAIHHGRIAYPSGDRGKDKEKTSHGTSNGSAKTNGGNGGGKGTQSDVPRTASIRATGTTSR